MAPRLDLQTLLEAVLESDAVYFQPPNNITLRYPCIVYQRSGIDIRHADNNPYKHLVRYTVTLIHRNPDNDVVDRLANLSHCSYDRFFTANNLNHDVFTIYF